jgi:GT2 family glycosyltransferase
MDSLPLVSIIIPNYNGKDFFEKLFKSLGVQSFRNFEVIVIDNHSSDGSVKVLSEVIPRFLSDIPVKVLLSDKNLGYCIANNRGLAASKGKYIIFLNNDTYVSSSWLEELVSVLDSNSRIAGCGSKIIDAKTDMLQTAGELLDQHGWVGSLLDIPKQSGILIDKFFYPSFVSVIIRRSLLEQSGAFDENLFITGDYDLCWRIRLLGFSFAASMASICYHYGSYTVRKFPDTARHYLLYKEKIYVLFKNFSFYNLVRRFPVSLTLMFSASAYKSLKLRQPYLHTLIRAFSWNLVNFKKLWLERKKVQSSRKVTDGDIESYMCRRFFVIDSRVNY